MLSRILYIPFVVLALVFLYIAWEIDPGYSVYLIPCVIVLAVLYVLSPQIDWWWYQRHPPDLDAPLRQLFQQQSPYYQQLSVEDKQLFRQRVALFMFSKEFKAQGENESIPEDVKAMIAAAAVQLTMGMEDFLLPRFENIVIYPKAFPSPQFPNRIHPSEIHEEDGVLIFSAEHVVHGFMNPVQYYPVALHEFAKVFLLHFPEKPWPETADQLWGSLPQIGRFDRESLVRYLNLPEEVIEPLPVSIVLFFSFPSRFRVALPQWFDRYEEIFNQRPLF